MTDAIVFAANGSEDIETVAAVDVFRRANFEVDLVSIEADRNVYLSHGVRVTCDFQIDDVDLDRYDVYYVPGGMGKFEKKIGGVAAFLDERGAKVKAYFKKNIGNTEKLFCAICAAPQIFREWGLLKPETKMTIHSDYASEFRGNYVDEVFVFSGNIGTSRGAGTTIDFALAIVKKIVNIKASVRIRQQLQLK